MESPLAQDRVIAAQEDSTSVNPGQVNEATEKVINDTNDLNCHTGTLTCLESDPMESTVTENSSTNQEESSTELKEETLKPEKELGNDLELKENGQIEEDSLKGGTSLPVSRKRPATDFLPINAEIKKIGVEISEEKAQQLKNEVRRLSPIHVSLRERTLGEISLISEPRVFLDDNTRFTRKEDFVCDSELDGIEVNLKNCSSIDSRVESCGLRLDKTSVIDKQSEENNSRLETDLEKCASSVGGVSNGENCKGLRELVLVLSRVDDNPLEKKNDISEKVSVDVMENDCLNKANKVDIVKEEKGKKEERINCSRTLTTSEEDMGLVIGRCVSYIQEQVAPKTEMFLVEKLEKNEELTVGDGVSLRKTSQVWESDRQQQQQLGASSVIEKIQVDEEIIFANSSLGIGGIQQAAQNSSELHSIGLSFQTQESVDTEETETGSDSSEVTSSIAAVQFRVEDHAISDQIPCSENDPLICDDIPLEIMTRLEPERPEPFTEDSAESLALAAGSRDEVRSDGSDSGLGSEIPGDSGPAPAPESDSETSFLDRIPDEILSDKEKTVNQLETFVPDINGQCMPQTSLPTFPSPPKSNLKRRLVDCMEGEPNAKRTNADEPPKKKRNIQFDAVTVYYFPRAQGFTCVPSQGGSTLGMSATHTHAERFSLSEHAAEQRRLHRARLAQLRTERAANRVTEAASSSEDPSDDTDEEPSDTEELDIDSYYFLQPVPTWQRRALLRAAGVRRIDAVEKDDCRDIRASREHCGCGCKGYCDPESCPCSRANVKCQVDRAGFPCGCSRDGCANSSGRIEFNPVRVRTHFIHTLMRLELEKKQRDEEHTDPDMVDNHSSQGPLREASLGSVIDNSADTCINGGGFTTLHYESHDSVVSSCQDITGVREDSLDLYAIRDDCYASEDTVDSSHNSQRKLHPEFHQTFQTFPGHPNFPVAFQQNTYADYQSYQNLPSTSRAPFQPQFPVSANPGFPHYGGYPTDGSMQQNCQTHPGQHVTGYETPFAQDEATGSQYTNLNSVQPMNAVVQQMGKLEPFSELLAGRYSYYGELEPQNHGNYHPNGTKLETDKIETNVQHTENSEECDENFGEIIKKSMVETVSA